MDNILKVKAMPVKFQVKSGSHYDLAHLHLYTNVQSKYKPSTAYSFQDIAKIKVLKVKLTTAKVK